ncbi:hypothetical protein [Fortiea contorta]|uniref:hypothetical protein n=1 Tax=Fortiea contorta TaxID=1892405 RepID=UPI0004760304|nr:hypothetical protein [Fortiea contorta]
MLKPLLLSGWFRVQPFLKYAVVVILIAPLVAVSAYSSAARQSQVAKDTFNQADSSSVSKGFATFGGNDLAQMLTAVKNDSVNREFNSASLEAVGESQLLPTDKIDSLATEANPLINVPANDLLAAVELAPSVNENVSEPSLVERLKTSKIQSLAQNLSVAQSLTATQTAPTQRQPQPNFSREVPVTEPVEGEQAIQIDPIGSPHPIPWKWIMATQEAIGGKGGSGVRYYRSVPVVSPDGKHIVYSRVKLEVQPEMYNSRVTSVLFVEDTQTKKLRVIASTSVLSDPLLQARAAAEQSGTNGKIGVLVPVSWSEKGDRFLARQFEGVFNTADATDRAVIWDRQKNHANTIAPTNQQNDEHEKIAILLGWSKNRPDQVMFRTGELGEENWPLMTVANDGKTLATTLEADQPITFGNQIAEVWPSPQFASR